MLLKQGVKIIPQKFSINELLFWSGEASFHLTKKVISLFDW